MKKIILSILTVLLSVSGYANFSTKTEVPMELSAVGDWVCPKCGTVNNGGHLCSHCWKARPY